MGTRTMYGEEPKCEGMMYLVSLTPPSSQFLIVVHVLHSLVLSLVHRDSNSPPMDVLRANAKIHVGDSIVPR